MCIHMSFEIKNTDAKQLVDKRARCKRTAGSYIYDNNIRFRSFPGTVGGCSSLLLKKNPNQN